jgi:biotin-dependent carboxylase-like uncharacterized protein
MDNESANIANKILGNDINESLLEITLMGPTLLFDNNYTLSITGGDFNPTINDKKIELYKPIDVKLGDILKINQTSNGARCYLAFLGGIACEKYLGSKSSLKNITPTYFLKKGDEIKVSNNNKLNFVVNHKLKLKTSSFLNVFSGPEFSILKKDSLHNLFNKEFTIGINNRMAYNLTEQIQTKSKSIISSPVLPGTVQLTPSGNIIILHRDCQTTGGYSRILQLNEKSLNNLSQLKNFDKIKFKLIK